MFVSHENKSYMKMYKKPNILRRNPKPVTKTSIGEQTFATKILTTTSANHTSDEALETNYKYKCNKSGHIVKRSNSKTKLDTNLSEDFNIKISPMIGQSTEVVQTQNNNVVHNFVENNSNNNNENIGFDVGLFSSYLIDEDNERKMEDFDAKYNLSDGKWSYVTVNEKNIKSEPNTNTNADWSETLLPTTGDYVLSSVTDTLKQEELTSIPLHCVFTNDELPFKCDEEGCTKKFSTDQKLKKHKHTHNKKTRIMHQCIECPVKMAGPHQNEPCGMMFHVRGNLLTHIKQDHTIDQAPYTCEVCYRRFFFVSALRAHSRIHGGEGVARQTHYTCTWAGCGRVFYQACRLKEHSRAHTGDKPYPCTYPNCEWSFRTASKLLRHSRRHTGDRRYRCAVCGSAFLRPEHLREHVARHTRPLYPCHVPGCKVKFVNNVSLVMHMKKVHKSIITADEVKTETNFDTRWSMDNSMYVDIKSDVTQDDVEDHAARTHCTWPLPARQHNQTLTEATYLVGGDVQVELSEGSENIFTVRSDLFLGDVNNDDSNGGDAMNMTVSADETAGGECAGSELVILRPSGTLDTEMDLLPEADLMQEQLMYASVDESSFVMLLDDEDLN